MRPRHAAIVAGVLALLSVAAAANVLLLQGRSTAEVAQLRLSLERLADRLRPGARQDPVAPAPPSRLAATGAPDHRFTAIDQTAAIGAEQPQAARLAGESADVIDAIRRELSQRGYRLGGADPHGLLTARAAVMAYEHDQRLPVTGRFTPQILEAIILGVSPSLERQLKAAASAGRGARLPADEIVALVQARLAAAGYAAGKPTTAVTPQLAAAIARYESAQGLPPTGRVSGALVLRLIPRAPDGRIATAR